MWKMYRKVRKQDENQENTAIGWLVVASNRMVSNRNLESQERCLVDSWKAQVGFTDLGVVTTW